MAKEFTKSEIKALIDKHDPALLFDLGVPEDEYAGEAHQVYEFLNKNPNKEQIAEGIKNIFATSFSHRTVEINPNAYASLAADIVKLLSTEQ